MTPKLQRLQRRPRLVLKQETVRLLSAEQLVVIAAGSIGSSPHCSGGLSTCPACTIP
jgi:hypothetical protein